MTRNRIASIRQSHEEEQNEARDRDTARRFIAYASVFSFATAILNALYAVKLGQLIDPGKSTTIMPLLGAVTGALGGVAAFWHFAPESVRLSTVRHIGSLRRLNERTTS
jgi:hypothetical protein